MNERGQWGPVVTADEPSHISASFQLGSDRNGVWVSVRSRQFPDQRDFDDGNWVFVDASVHVAGMSAVVRHEFLRTEEIAQFLDQLERMDAALAGRAELQTMEEWFDLRVRCEPNGALQVHGTIDDSPGGRNRLVFALEGLDQTYLAECIDGLRTVMQAFPVVGKS